MRFTLVKSKNGVQPPQTSCDFSPPGGTIGRSEDNNFTLPDENRAISRLQALVHISADGECRLTNRGNVINIEFNGIPLERGRQVELQDGDRLGIGDYLIEVSSLNSPARPQHSVADQPASRAGAMVKPTAAIPGAIWDSLAEEFSPPPQRQPASPPPSDALAAHGHPLTEITRQELNPADPLSQIAQPAELRQLDLRETDPARLFTDESLFKQDNILNNPTPSTLLAQEQTQAAAENEQRREIDPLALFGGASTVTDGGDLFGILADNAQPLTQPEQWQPAMEPEQKPLSATSASVTPAPEPASAVIISSPDLDEPAIETRQRAIETTVSQTLVSPGAQPYTTQEKAPAAVASLSSGRMGIDPIPHQRSSAGESDGTNPLLEGDLLKGLLQGIGLDDMHNQPEFGEQQLRLLGQIISLFSQGTVALLSSRSMLKRGVKAEMTMILDDANNPFKLLPSGKTVLMQMFGTQMPGFMPPEQAVRDALIDLQAHQLGMIAGIRAIIAAMLQSFNPELLEAHARTKGDMPRLAMSTKRKAALWDYFIKHYQKTSGEVEDDFHTLFGEAFLHAYDVEVDQYKDLQTKQGK